ERVPALVVGEDQDDVRPPGRPGGRGRGEAGLGAPPAGDGHAPDHGDQDGGGADEDGPAQVRSPHDAPSDGAASRGAPRRRRRRRAATAAAPPSAAAAIADPASPYPMVGSR